MIKYKLKCNKCEITYDSWFSSSNDYENLKKKNFIRCYACDSIRVEKTLMSPGIVKLINYKKTSQPKEISKKIFQFQKFIKENFNYVGHNFSYEARSMHYGNKKNLKGIYGTAKIEDLQELKEEGIKVQTIPWLKKKSN